MQQRCLALPGAQLSPVTTIFPPLVSGNQPALCCPDGSAFVIMSHTGSQAGSGSCHCDHAPETHPTYSLVAAGRLRFLLRPAATGQLAISGEGHLGVRLPWTLTQGLHEHSSLPLRDTQQWHFWVMVFEEPPRSVPTG